MENQFTEKARFNMVEQQIRPAEVLDPEVLSLVADVHREDFVPQRYRDLAFCDSEIPLNDSEVMMKPIVEARMLQALSVSSTDKVLEIGSGSGYVTCLLAKMSQSVISLELDEKLAETAKENLSRAGINNAKVLCMDGSKGYPEQGLYEVIAVTASLPSISGAIEQQLSVGGRAFMIVGRAPNMEAMLITRISETEFQRDALFETVIPPMRNIPEIREFEF